MYIVVLFVDSNEIQHVPNIWFKQNKKFSSEEIGICWFPRTKADISTKNPLYFKSSQICKMISDCYIPNDIDGLWYKAAKKSGQFVNEMKARKMAKAWSDLSDDGDDNHNTVYDLDLTPYRSKRKKIKSKMLSNFDVDSDVTTRIEKKIKPSAACSIAPLDLPEPLSTPAFNGYNKTSKLSTHLEENTEPMLVPRETCNDISRQLQFPIVIEVPNDNNDTTIKMDNLNGLNGHDNELDCLLTEEFQTFNDSYSLQLNNGNKVFSAELIGKEHILKDNSLVQDENTESLFSTQSNSKQFTKQFSSSLDKSGDVEVFSTQLNNDEQSITNMFTQDDNEAEVDDSLHSSGEQSATKQTMLIQDMNLSNFNELKMKIEALHKSNTKRDEIIMAQILMMNKSIVKLCSTSELIFKKIDYISEFCRGRKMLNIQVPRIPVPFINTLPIKTVPILETVEELLADSNSVPNHFELMKEYIYLNAGTDGHYSNSHSIRKALDLCFTKEILNLYSFHGRSKRSFKNLLLFKVIKEALSGLLNTPEDERKFIQVVENYLKHAAIKPTSSSASKPCNDNN